MRLLRAWFMPVTVAVTAVGLLGYAVFGHEYGWRIAAGIGGFFLVAGACAAFFGEQG